MIGLLEREMFATAIHEYDRGISRKSTGDRFVFFVGETEL